MYCEIYWFYEIDFNKYQLLSKSLILAMLSDTLLSVKCSMKYCKNKLHYHRFESLFPSQDINTIFQQRIVWFGVILGCDCGMRLGWVDAWEYEITNSVSPNHLLK